MGNSAPEYGPNVNDLLWPTFDAWLHRGQILRCGMQVSCILFRIPNLIPHTQYPKLGNMKIYRQGDMEYEIHMTLDNFKVSLIYWPLNAKTEISPYNCLPNTFSTLLRTLGPPKPS